MTVTLASGGYRAVDVCTRTHEYHILAGTKLFLDRRLGSMGSMKPGSDTHLIVLK